MLLSLQYFKIFIVNLLSSSDRAKVTPEKWNTSTPSKAFSTSKSSIFILLNAESALSYITFDDLLPLPTCKKYIPVLLSAPFTNVVSTLFDFKYLIIDFPISSFDTLVIILVSISKLDNDIRTLASPPP